MTKEKRKLGAYCIVLRQPLDPKLGLIPSQTEADRSAEMANLVIIQNNVPALDRFKVAF